MDHISHVILISSICLCLFQLSQTQDCSDVLSCPILESYQGSKGDSGPQGEVGPPGPVGKCPEPECAQESSIFVKGPQGDPGTTELCSSSCSGIYGVRGPQGPQGPRGDNGDALSLSYDDAYRLVQNTMEQTQNSEVLLGPKGFPGRNLSVLRFARSNPDYNDSNDSINLKLKQPQRRFKRSIFNLGEQPSQQTSEEQEADLSPLGVTMLEDINKLKTIGQSLPIGALVVAILPNRIPSSRRPHNLAMFMKVEFENNKWARMPIEFHGERNFGYQGPLEDNSVPNHTPQEDDSESSEHQWTNKKPVMRKQIVMAPYPIPMTGGSVATRINADHGCHELGQNRLGIPGFKSFLVGQDATVDKIIPWQFHDAPVVNLANQIMYSSWMEFIYGLPSKENVGFFDLNGLPDLESQNEKQFWLGGGQRYTCDSWQSNSALKVGLVWSWNVQNRTIKFNHVPCTSTNYLMCYKLVRILDR